MTTERGHEVPLTLAGYRLRMGATYHLRVAGPAREIRLVGHHPLLVRRQGEPQALMENGVEGFYQAIRVQPAGVGSMAWNLGIYPEVMEVEIVLRDGRKLTTSIPVLLELKFTWKIFLWLILWALLSLVAELILAALTEQRMELLTSPMPWIRGLCLALLSPLFTFIRRIWVLRQRAHTLEQEFRETWRNPEPAVHASRES